MTGHTGANVELDANAILYALAAEIENLFPAQCDYSFVDIGDSGEAAIKIVPYNPESGSLLVIYSAGTFYIEVDEWYWLDSEDDPTIDSPVAWAVSEIAKVARSGVADVGPWAIPFWRTYLIPGDSSVLPRIRRSRWKVIHQWSAPWSTQETDK